MTLFKTCAIPVFILALLAIAQPGFALDKSQQNVAGAMTLVSVLMYAVAPWLTGFVADFGVLKLATPLKWLKIALTAILGMVLGYPSIWFSLSAFLFLPGGPESMVAWVACAVILVIALGAVKVVAYWVVNEAFPSKKTSLLLFLSSTAMVVAAFVVLTIAPPKAPDAKPAAEAPNAKPAAEATDAKPAAEATDAQPAAEATDAKPAAEATDSNPADE